MFDMLRPFRRPKETPVKAEPVAEADSPREELIPLDELNAQAEKRHAKDETTARHIDIALAEGNRLKDRFEASVGEMTQFKIKEKPKATEDHIAAIDDIAAQLRERDRSTDPDRY